MDKYFAKIIIFWLEARKSLSMDFMTAVARHMSLSKVRHNLRVKKKEEKATKETMTKYMYLVIIHICTTTLFNFKVLVNFV